MHHAARRLGVARARINPLAQLQGQQPLHMGCVHQRPGQVPVVGTALGINRDGAIEMLKRLGVLAGAAHDTAPCRLNISQGKTVIRGLECLLRFCKQPQSLFLHTLLEEKPGLVNVDHRREHRILARSLRKLTRGHNLRERGFVFALLPERSSLPEMSQRAEFLTCSFRFRPQHKVEDLNGGVNLSPRTVHGIPRPAAIAGSHPAAVRDGTPLEIA
jgi:hypothetical protein